MQVLYEKSSTLLFKHSTKCTLNCAGNVNAIQILHIQYSSRLDWCDGPRNLYTALEKSSSTFACALVLLVSRKSVIDADHAPAFSPLPWRHIARPSCAAHLLFCIVADTDSWSRTPNATNKL